MAINYEPTVEPQTVASIFTKHIAKVIPLAFDESMSYYECICAFRDYLNTVIIPNVNNVNDGLAELQQIFLDLQTAVNTEIERFENTVTNEINDFETEMNTNFNTLQDFVNNYFDNLDVQDEINNKLDDMLKDGTLDQIIEQYLISSAIWGFDTVADMKQATNLINGSFAKTLGYYNVNDGGSGEYVIVDDNTLVADNGSIIALNNGLFAKLILNEKVNIKQFGAIGDNTTDNYNAITNALNYCKSQNIMDLYIPSGFFLINTNIVIDFPINITGEYSSFNPNTTISKNSSVLVDGYSGEQPFIKLSRENATTTDKRIYGSSISNIQILGNENDHCGLYLYQTGWNGVIENCAIWNFLGDGLVLDRVFDTSLNNVSIIDCGSRETSISPKYPMKFIDSTSQDTTNAIHIYGLHIEGSYYHLYLDRALNCVFTNCKFEGGSSTNNSIIITENAQMIDFVGCMFIPYSFHNNEISHDEVPYFIDINYISNLAKMITFTSCQFKSTTPKGAKYISSKGRTNINGCSFTVLPYDTYGLDLEDSQICNSNFLIQTTDNVNTDMLKVKKCLISNCLFRCAGPNITHVSALDLLQTNTISINKYDNLTNIYKPTSRYNDIIREGLKVIGNNEYYAYYHLTSETADWNNLQFDSSKLDKKIYLFNFSQDVSLKRITSNISGDEIIIINNANHNVNIGTTLSLWDGTEIEKNGNSVYTLGQGDAIKLINNGTTWVATSIKV